jgi:hypothetical protein
MPETDLNDRVLRAICARAGHREGARVEARPLAAELGIELKELFSAIVVLVDSDFLEYRGAGPLVDVTRLGALRCGHLASSTEPPAAES